MTTDDFLTRLRKDNRQQPRLHVLGRAVPATQQAKWRQWSEEHKLPKSHLELLLQANGIKIGDPSGDCLVEVYPLKEIRPTQEYLDEMEFEIELPSEHCWTVARDFNGNWVLFLDGQSGRYAVMDAWYLDDPRIYKDLPAALDWLVKDFVPEPPPKEVAPKLPKKKPGRGAAAAPAVEMTLLAERKLGGLDGVGTVALAPDGRSLLAGRYEGVVHLAAPDLNVLPSSLPRGSCRQDVAWLPNGEQAIIAFDWAPNRKEIEAVDRRCRLIRFEISSARQVFECVFPSSPYCRIQLSPDARWLAARWSVDNVKGLYFVDAASGKTVGSAAGMACWDKRLDFAPDGSLMVSTESGQHVRLSVPEGKVTQTFDFGKESLACLAVAPTGDRVATVAPNSEKFMVIYDLATGKPEHVLKGHKRFIMCCRFSPDGRFLATGGGDGAVMVWSMATGKAVAKTHLHKSTDRDPRCSIVEDVVFDAAGRTLYTCGRDGYVRALAMPEGEKGK